MANVFNSESTEMDAMSNAIVINHNKITSISELEKLVSNAELKGQFVSLECETPVKLNKFPTDGSERIRIKDGFNPSKHYIVTFNLGDSTYTKKMSDALNVDNYQAHDTNRIHLVNNILMQYVSTGTVCFIYMPVAYTDSYIKLNGNMISETDELYLNRYRPTRKSESPVEYRTVNVKNVKSITIGKKKYELNFECKSKVAA